VNAWLSARDQGETQQGFCSRQNISTRQLRALVKKLAPTQPPVEVALGIVDRAITDLQRLKASIADRKVEVEAASPTAAPTALATEPVADRNPQQNSSEKPVMAPAPTVAPPRTTEESPPPFDFDSFLNED